MDAVKQNGHICRDCRYYDPYYEKYGSYFYKLKNGYCMQRQKAVNSNDLCKSYKYRLHKDKVVTIEHLDNAIADIKEMLLLLQPHDR